MTDNVIGKAVQEMLEAADPVADWEFGRSAGEFLGSVPAELPPPPPMELHIPPPPWSPRADDSERILRNPPPMTQPAPLEVTRFRPPPPDWTRERWERERRAQAERGQVDEDAGGLEAQPAKPKRRRWGK